MGTYLNPGSSGFESIRRGIYVDKSGLIALINDTIETSDKLTCVSRPRRFGKSFAAQMLCAYYDKTGNSALFDDLKIAEYKSYRTYLNKYDVIYLDMTNIMGEAGTERLVSFIRRKVTEELLETCPDLKEDESFSATLIKAAELLGNKFIMIIDEWDAPLRESPEIQKEYLKFLRTLFKGSGTTDKIFAAAYMTGILPIKKDGSQSAISNFQEYTILEPDGFAEYTGFSETEVRNLCRKYGMNFEEMKIWYDGYILDDSEPTYNPYSVMSAVKRKKIRSYWKKTSAAEALQTYIDINKDGLQEEIIRLISGESVKVDPEEFENDFRTFRSRDDVLTLLIHLGYLTYMEKDSLAKIPNEEIRAEFRKLLRRGKHQKLLELIRASDQLLEDTLHGNEEAVARAVEKVRDSAYAPAFYNDEQALRSAVRCAYITCVDQYMKIEELPSGHGIADIVYVPFQDSRLPALIIELKWNKSAKGAVAQIKDRNYPAVLEPYVKEIILVGISYNETRKKHTCVIEKIH